jgi:hypothetical protein
LTGGSNEENRDQGAPESARTLVEQGEGRTALVDGANVAHSTEVKPPRLENILLVCEKLREKDFKPIVVVDAALRHNIDDEARFEELVDQGEIRQAPAGTDADYFILSFAREMDARIVSNDRFRDHVGAFPDAQDRLIRYMIVEGEVVLERRGRSRS